MREGKGGNPDSMLICLHQLAKLQGLLERENWNACSVEFTTPRNGQTRNSEVMPIDRPKSLMMKIHRHEEMLKAR